MSNDQPIDILAGFKTKENKFTGKQKVYMEIVAPQLLIDPEALKGQLTEAVGTAIQNAIKTNLLAGLYPDGTPLPPLAPSTIERRQYRDEQYGRTNIETSRGKKSQLRFHYREDESHPRTQRGDAYKRAGRLRRRFHARRLGIWDPRSHPNALPGCESGLLANSVIAKPSRSGGWAVYFTDIRTDRDRSGRSAVERVLGRGHQWAPALMKRPDIQHMLKYILDRALTRKIAKAWAEARGIYERAARIEGELQQFSEERPED